ncbi:MAG: hypothetical protein ACWA5T_06010 [Parvularcula sp.]
MRVFVAPLAMAAMLTACASSPEPTPAVLLNADAETMSQVKATLSKATGQARIRLGAGDPTKSSVLSALPPGPTSLEGNSPALPEVFEIVRIRDRCALKRRKDGMLFPLEGIACKVRKSEDQ